MKMLIDHITKEPTVWERLQEENRPIVLYGMGDGAEKILRVFAEKGIRASGVFASDEFVRGHDFAGFRVKKLSDLTAELGEDLVVVLSFASQRPEVLEKFYELDARFDLVAPDVPVAGDGLFDRAYFTEHLDKFSEAFDLMADETARRCFADIMNFKLTGKIQYLRSCETDKDEVFHNILRPTDAEHFADLGAYNGDTIRELLSYTDGKYASITALEPDARTFRKLRAYADEHLTGDVTLVNAGAWSQDTTMTFAARAGRNSALAAKGVETQMRSLDSVLDGRPCTMLKYDIEGAERKGLLGAAQTIRRYAPKLNLACYHRNEDLFDLTLLVHALCPGHKLYLRHHPYVPAWDVNLYAAPN